MEGVSMKITIQREKSVDTFEVSKNLTLLSALYEIKENQDASLTFSSGCRASVCGTCSVRVNGKEVLACAHKVQEGDRVEPLQYHPILRDLKVDKSQAQKKLAHTQAWLHQPKQTPLSPKDEQLTERQSDCILCDSCYSACPVLAVNPDFLGPFALTRAYRYSVDTREGNAKEMIDSIQENGVWDCTLCGECTAVCPKGIDPKMDITMLRGTSLQIGHSDPSFSNQSFGTPDFGFDPNGGF
jgi:fumarate reductase iron-sulfur subunit